MKLSITAMFIASLLLTSSGFAEDAKVEEKKELKEQTTCPVMGGKIVKEQFVDHEGKRIYICCAGCRAPLKKDPAKYIKQLEDEGITLDLTPPEEKKTEKK